MREDILILKKIIEIALKKDKNESENLAINLIEKYGSIVNLFKEKEFKSYNLPNELITLISSFNKIYDKMTYIKCFGVNDRIKSLEELISYLRYSYSSFEREVLKILYFNNQSMLIKDENIFYGTIDNICIFEREILKNVLKYNAKYIIIVHNHLSGDSNPSKSDIKFTQKIKKILKYIDTIVYDHIIITSSSYYSFKENRLI